MTFTCGRTRIAPKSRPSLGEASACDIGHCPEMSRDTKGYTRRSRPKASLKVAGSKSSDPYAAQCQNSTSVGSPPFTWRGKVLAYGRAWRSLVATREFLFRRAAGRPHAPQIPRPAVGRRQTHERRRTSSPSHSHAFTSLNAVLTNRLVDFPLRGTACGPAG